MKTAAALLILALQVLSPTATAAEQLVLEWQVRQGDDPQWALPSLDDSGWSRVPSWDVDPQDGILWARAQVDTTKLADGGSAPLGVLVMAAAAWQLYWNGVQVGHSGTPAADAAHEQAGPIVREILIPPELIRPQGNVIALRSSAFHNSPRLGAPIQAVLLRPFGSPDRTLFQRSELALVAAGPLLLGAVYFLVMFAMNRKDIAALLLGLLALCLLGQLTAELLRSFYIYPYPWHAPRLVAVFVFASSSMVLLVMYVARQTVPRAAISAASLMLISACVIALLVPGFDGKTASVMMLGLLVSLTLSLVAVLRRMPGAIPMTLALGLLATLLVLDAIRFIDVSYYLAASALVLHLFLRQASVLRESQRQRASSEMRAIRLELELLRQAIQPHFLMNTLTALMEWVERSPATGVRMIEALGGELRMISSLSGRPLITLREELELCRQHLVLMGFRGDQSFVLETQDVQMEALVPPALFHTLLENALTHNRYTAGARFVLKEEVPGPWRTWQLRSPRTGHAARAGGRGTGHAYVQATLRHAFGARADGLEWVDTVSVPCAS
jgi:hypothetical protein